MRVSRLRGGERLALAGAVALGVLLFLDWFYLSTPDARIGAHETGIAGLGWFATALLLSAIIAAIGLAVVTVTHDAPAWPVVLAVFATVLGLFAVLAIAVRLVAQPGLGVDAGNADVDLEPAAWLGLLAALALAAGGARSMGDERTDTPESRDQTDDVLRVRGAARPAPPRTAATPSGPPDALADPSGT